MSIQLDKNGNCTGCGWDQPDVPHTCGAGPSPTTQRYYVAQIDLVTGQGFTSLHHTADGAHTALVNWAADCGVHNHGIPVAQISDLDGHPMIASYSVSHLPVQP